MAKVFPMRLRSPHSALCLPLALGLGVFAVGCAHAPAPAASALEQAVAAEDDLGTPRRASEPLDEAEQQAMLDDPSATRVDFDGDDPNDAPVDRIAIPPDRQPMPSLMRTVTMGPSS